MNELNPNLNKANKEVTMELNFIKSGDYYIPDIKLKNPNIRLGKWGRMRREYGRSTLMEISGDIEVKTVPEKRSSWINNSIGLDIIG